MLEKLVAAVPNMTLQQLFEKIILEGGILNHVMGSPDKIFLMKIITGLMPGSVTCQNACKVDAPSSRAASTIAFGTARNAAWKGCIANGRL